MDLTAFRANLQIPGKRARLGPTQKRLAKMIDDALAQGKRWVTFNGRRHFLGK